MPDVEVTVQRILQDSPRLGLDDPLDFCCQKDLSCFTSCCSDVSIVLTPYDVLRMKNALQIDSTEFLNRYSILSCTRDKKLPVVLLRMNAADKRCPFVTKEGCTIYDSRPWACRMYPLGLAEPAGPSPAAGRFYFSVKEGFCQGHGKEPQSTVRDWIASQGLETYEMMSGSFTQLMLNDFWKKDQPLSAIEVEMYVMACYDLDRFRRFIFETKFLKLFEVDEDRLAVIRTDEAELLDFAMEWLRFSLFKEKTMHVLKSVLEARQKSSAHAEGGAGAQT